MKKCGDIRDLAIFNGEPIFDAPRHVNKPNVADYSEFLANFEPAWESRWFTNNGPLVIELEDKLSNYLGVENCVLTCNGTVALELLIRAIGLTGEVIIPSFTFISTAHVLSLAGIQPRFCDIKPTDMNVDCDDVAMLINNKTSAVIATHLWGQACNIERLEELCNAANISLIFDAAHAFGSTYKGVKIGGFGNAEVFSLHATKVLHSFEGGLISTKDVKLASKLRKMRNFGFTEFDNVEMLGTNAKMSEVHAAMGLANLAAIEKTISENKRRHNRYFELLKDIPGLYFHRSNDEEVSNFHYAVVELSPNEFGIERDILMEILHKENILARRYFYPGAHRSKPHQVINVENGRPLPVTEDICNRVMILPAGSSLHTDDVTTICELIRFISTNSESISNLLAKNG